MFEGQAELVEREYPQLKNRVWLNSAAFAPHATSVKKAMNRFINYFHDPTISVESDKMFEEVDKSVFEGAAKLFDCPKDNVSLVINTAHGLNYPLNGIDWKKGDNIVTSDLEFPTNFYPWLYVSKKKGVELRAAKINEKVQIDEDEIIELIDDNTKLVSLSLVQFNNGQRVDAERIAKVAHEHGAYVSLDAIQACNAIEVYPKKMNVDFLSAGGLKFMLGPLGIGLCYVSDKAIEEIDPPLQGCGNYDFSDHNWMDRNKPYHKGARRYQNGTIPPYCTAGLDAALKIVASVGIKTVSDHNLELTQRLIEGFNELGLQVITPIEKHRRGALVNVRVGKDKDLDKIVKTLEDKYKVTVSNRFNGLRFSAHLFNTEEHIETALAALAEVLK
ncbi:MAG: aminotransferase class V-fold PLP-dependent enzyme [Candidatus Heimdallarchaeota archaeon]